MLKTISTILGYIIVLHTMLEDAIILIDPAQLSNAEKKAKVIADVTIALNAAAVGLKIPEVIITLVDKLIPWFVDTIVALLKLAGILPKSGSVNSQSPALAVNPTPGI